MRFLPLCESAKKGHACIDDLCRGSSPTLCGFDQDDYDEMTRDYEGPDYLDESDEEEEFDCGMDRNGGCGLIGTEECDFECPYRDSMIAELNRKKANNA